MLEEHGNMTIVVDIMYIATVHQLAAACDKYKVITFTDKDDNIINNINDPEKDANNLEITGMDITGVRIENENVTVNTELDTRGVQIENDAENNTGQNNDRGGI